VSHKTFVLGLFVSFAAMAQQNQPLPVYTPQSQSQAEPQAPRMARLRLEGRHFLGSRNAPVTIVEFTDYQCPFCRGFKSATFPDIRKKYIDTGRVRFVVRDFPLTEDHPEAMLAAEAAHCAGDQEKFWPMHDLLFSDASKLGRNGLLDAAASLKLDMEAFRSCLESGRHNAEIQNDMKVGSSLQINGTPAYFVGKTIGGEVTGVLILGAQPLSVFEGRIRAVEIAP
jgi:protein-disulfide isomerase